jgi:hypothetical protein
MPRHRSRRASALAPINERIPTSAHPPTPPHDLRHLRLVYIYPAPRRLFQRRIPRITLALTHTL